MISLKTPREIDIMRRNGRLLAKILKELKKECKAGRETIRLERLASELIFSYGAIPSFKGYNRYPNVLCVSLNEEVVHALPKKRKLREGDIVSLDLGLKKDGFHADAALTFGIGTISKEAQKLIKTTKNALKEAIKQVKPGNKLGLVSFTIQSFIETRGFKVIKDLTGHGIGRNLHEPPQVLNFGSPLRGPILRPGMTLALEPMASLGSDRIKKGKDGFAFVTQDGSLAAHFEVTIAVTQKGGEILTPGIVS